MSRPRTIVAICLAVPLAACGAETPTASKSEGPTLLARSGAAVVAIDAGSGRELRRTRLGAHDLQWRAIYDARPAGDGTTTTVTATDPVTGRRLRSTDVPGLWKIPVAAGSTPEGAVSGDGKWLVLAGDHDEGASRFAMLPTTLDAAPQQFRLRGRFDFDALSPDGSAIFLSQLERSGRYRVRAFDIRRGRLRRQVVVDKTAVGTIMQGLPVARAVDPTGSPVHTLYRGGPMGAFVHSLNTADGTALCILIPRSRKAGPAWRLRLDPETVELHALNPGLGKHLLIGSSGEVVDAPAGTPVPGTELDDYEITADGAVRAGTRRIAEVGADAELLALR